MRFCLHLFSASIKACGYFNLCVAISSLVGQFKMSRHASVFLKEKMHASMVIETSRITSYCVVTDKSSKAFQTPFYIPT